MRKTRVRLETRRLVVRDAVPEDAAFIASLWSDPRVMRFVGFPHGIPTAATDVPRRIERGRGDDVLLIAELCVNGEPVGQCMLGEPSPSGVSEPDIKLHPSFWGRGYGRELWAALVDQAFLRTTCVIVRGTPNVANIASIRMQESAAMKRVGEGVAGFPALMRDFTTPVPHYVYEISRAEWMRRASAG
ncbi:MAG: GNAT family protein [Thermotogota bacterium]